jgi:hypothetical protein
MQAGKAEKQPPKAVILSSLFLLQPDTIQLSLLNCCAVILIMSCLLDHQVDATSYLNAMLGRTYSSIYLLHVL